MPDNARKVKPTERTVFVDRQDEMELYDELPFRYRQLIQAAPLLQGIQEVLQVIDLYGEDQAYELICQEWERAHNGWQRPQ